MYPDADGPICRIVFLGNPEFSFEFDRRFTTTYSPGGVFATTEHNNHRYSEVINDLTSSTRGIEEELTVQLPIYDECEEFRRTVEEKLDGHIQDPEAHSSQEDLEQLHHTMEAMRASLEEMQKKNQLTEEQVQKANDRINRLERLAQRMRKKDWFRTTINSLYGLLRAFGIPSLGKPIASQYAMRLLGCDNEEPPKAA